MSRRCHPKLARRSSKTWMSNDSNPKRRKGRQLIPGGGGGTRDAEPCEDLLLMESNQNSGWRFTFHLPQGSDRWNLGDPQNVLLTPLKQLRVWCGDPGFCIPNARTRRVSKVLQRPPVRFHRRKVQMCRFGCKTLSADDQLGDGQNSLFWRNKLTEMGCIPCICMPQ